MDYGRGMARKLAPSYVEIYFEKTPDGLVVSRIIMHSGDARAEKDLRKFLDRLRDPELDVDRHVVWQRDSGAAMSESLWKVLDVATRMAVGESTVYRLVEQGILPPVRVPGTNLVRFRRERIEELLREWERAGRRRGRGNGRRLETVVMGEKEEAPATGREAGTGARATLTPGRAEDHNLDLSTSR